MLSSLLFYFFSFIYIVDTMADVPTPSPPLPHSCLCPQVMHAYICSLVNPFTFFHPVASPPPILLETCKRERGILTPLSLTKLSNECLSLTLWPFTFGIHGCIVLVNAGGVCYISLLKAAQFY